MKKFEIWACFPDGTEAKVEAHASARRAQIAVDAMNHANERERAEGYGFPYGVPEYEIR